MTWRILRIATTLIIIQSLLFFPAPVSRAQDSPTKAEILLAQEASDLFLKRLVETSDFASVIKEMYVEDFIERYLRQQILEGEESGSSSVIRFAPWLTYKRDLLKLATVEDWRRLYVATNNFIYQTTTTFLNKHADDLLSDRELDDEMFEKLIPPDVIALFNERPVLKSFLGFDDEDDKPRGSDTADGKPSGAIKNENEAKPIETPEEMRIATETIQEGLRLLLKDQGNHSPRLTESAKKALYVARQKHGELIEPVIEISDKKFLGLPPGTRLLNAPTFILFWLSIAEVNGKQKIIWAQFISPIC